MLDDVIEVLVPEHFYSDAHQRLFKAIMRLHERGIRGILRSLHVGLVEGVDPELGPGGGDGDLEGHVQGAGVKRLAQVEPAEAEQVQVTPCRVAGGVSVTVTPLAMFGPALATVMV